eukprot:3979458-Lingulodinium_polyedra.AAC.1
MGLRAQRRVAVDSIAAVEARQRGLWFMQANIVGPAAAGQFSKEVGEFRVWVQENRLDGDCPEEVGSCLAEYLDEIFFQGHNREKGDHLL